MNPTHIHLLINHLPVIGSMLGALVLGYGLWAKSNPTMLAAYFIFIISAIGASVAYSTGESAEETVEHIDGVSHDRIKEHEESAIYALVSLLLLGAGSIAGVYLTTSGSRLARPVAMTMLIISLISYAIIARTGYLGGQIRHTELNDKTVGSKPAD